MENFELHSTFKPTGDQPKAIKQLVDGLKIKHKLKEWEPIKEISDAEFEMFEKEIENTKTEEL